jgi:TonB family protein
MESAVNYIIESSLSLGLMVMLYRAWFKRQPVMWFNRLYLLLALLVSVSVPLIHYTLKQPAHQVNMLPEVQVGTGYELLETVVVWGAKTQLSFVEKLQQLPWLKLIYLTGIVMLISKLLIGLLKIRWHRQKGVAQNNAGFLLVDTRNQLGPFSFFNILFINQNQYKADEIKVIIDHELAHIKLKHTYDILLLELILIVQWINPFAWLLRHDLKEIHEFQADQYTLQAGTNPAQYRELLVIQALGTRVDLGHNFSQSLIKKRLKMMNSKNNKSLSIFKPLAALMMVAILIMAFGYDEPMFPPPPPPTKDTPVTDLLLGDNTTANFIDTIAPPPPPVPSEKLVPPPPPPIETDTTVYSQTEVMPEFPGGMSRLMEFLGTSIVYPKEAMQKKITGKVFVYFVVDKKGKVVNAKITRGVDPLLDQEALRVVNSMPAWKPGTQGGDPKNVSYTLPINFALTVNATSNEKLAFVEQMPEFPGGQTKLMEYMRTNVKYPTAAMEKNQTGKAYVSFDVMEDGSVQAVKIEKSTGYELLDNEAIRVVSAMPKWNPGKQQGEAVKVNYVVPIAFALKDKNYGVIVIDDMGIKTSELFLQNITIDKNMNKTVMSGIVHDNNKTPLKNASVVVAGSTRGTITDEFGKFQIELQPGDEKLTISFVGKETKEIPISSTK